MAFIEVVIKIPEELYKALLNGYEEPYSQMFSDVVKNGTPLPKGHGRLIDADALVYWECNGDCDMCCDDDKCGMVKEAPTIIEADKESV